MSIQFTRRHFLAGSAALGFAVIPRDLFGSNVDGEGVDLNPVQREALRLALRETDPRYNPQEKMVTSKVSSVGYHTTLKSGAVHPTRESFTYAVALLDSGEATRQQRAEAILDRVIAQQDQNPENRTYGIWSWYLEEPLDKMSPPDWNWADFCGAQLLAVWTSHRNRLNEDLRDRVRESILHAARSIQRRNVGPGYTNIAIMGTYVTITAGEQFVDSDILEYGRQRLRRFYDYTMEQGTFTEYNSPTYSIVALEELSRMIMHFQNEEDLRLVNDLLDLGWKHVARHFHAPTRQWAGPHSRCYSTNLLEREKTLAFLEHATGAQGYITDMRPLPLGLGAYRLPIHCPEEYHHYFVELQEPRFEVETFLKGAQSGGDTVVLGARPQRDIIGSTYLHPKYTLGSVNIGDFWNQRRPFLAYWGTPDQPVFLRMRFLHDGYDYCSALLFTHQHEGEALAALVFATDYGDTHPSLDRVKNATIRAEDLRLRLEIGGNCDRIRIQKSEEADGTYLIEDDTIRLTIRDLGNQFGNESFRWEIVEENGCSSLDAVAWSGEASDIDFSQLEKAFLAFAFSVYPMGAKPAPLSVVSLEMKEDTIRLSWPGDAKPEAFQVSAQPGPLKEVRGSFLVS